MNKHTAGPWHYDWLDDDHGWIIDQDGNYIAEIVTRDSAGKCRPQDARANARLLAESPAILEVLKSIARAIERGGLKFDDEKLLPHGKYELLWEISKAISRAEGLMS